MLRLYNTYSQKKEIFKPLNDKQATIYTCGPTVYDYAHIGNFRSFIMADVLKRYLTYSGYKVKHAKNITDVGHLTQSDIERGEDKMIAAAQKTGQTPKDIADYFTKAFMEDEKKLNIIKADANPRATDYIEKMIKAIQKLINEKYAYESGGSVFYDVAKFKKYGKLSGNTLAKLKKAARLEENPLKKNWFDFALWLKAPKDHLMTWDSQWSRGYPGWHIECSVMSIDNLGQTIDIHTGGEDNVFPHHENEIAQSEALTGKKFVNTWLHVRHLLVDGKKMSKSEGNFYTLKDLEEKGFSPLAFRFLVLQSHYRNQMNFTLQAARDAENALNGLKEFINNLNKYISNAGTPIEKLIIKNIKLFKKYMDDDLNTPRALSVLFDFIGAIKNKKVKMAGKNDIDGTSRFIETIDSVLGLNLKKGKQTVPLEIKNLAEERDKLRKEKKWLEADKIRKEINKLGYDIEDMPAGTRIKNKK